MQRERSSETLPLFGDYALTAGEARRAIQAYSGVGVIWEWRGQGAERDYRAGVTLLSPAAEKSTSVIGHGESPTDALGDLLWQLAIPVLLAEETATPARESASSRAN